MWFFSPYQCCGPGTSSETTAACRFMLATVCDVVGKTLRRELLRVVAHYCSGQPPTPLELRGINFLLCQRYLPLQSHYLK